MNTAIDALIVVLPGVVLTIIGVIIVRARYKDRDLTEHHEVAGYLLQVVGTLYAVLLGLIVVNIQSKFDQARLEAETEANACSDIWQLSRPVPLEQRRVIRGALQHYYQVVQSEDWEEIRKGKIETSTAAYQRLWKSVSDVVPANNRENANYSAMLTAMEQLSDSRRFRLFSSKRGVSPIVWTVLIVGAVLTVLFTYFFAVKSAKTQLILSSFVALFISLNLLLVQLFDNPYRNEFRVKEGAFSFDAKRIGEHDAEPAVNAPDLERDGLLDR